MYEKTHDNLLEALKNLDRLMGDDGKAVASGLHAYLKKYEVAYNHDTAKVLYEKKIVGRHKDSTHKEPLIFYNVAKPPSSAMVYEILADVKKHRKAREERAEKKRLEVKKPVVTEETVLMNLRQEASNEYDAIQEDIKTLKREAKLQRALIEMITNKLNS